jgi:hypothetical protein
MIAQSRNVARAGSDGTGSFIPCNADGGAIDNGGGGGVLTVSDSAFDDNLGGAAAAPAMTSCQRT